VRVGVEKGKGSSDDVPASCCEPGAHAELPGSGTGGGRQIEVETSEAMSAKQRRASRRRRFGSQRAAVESEGGEPRRRAQGFSCIPRSAAVGASMFSLDEKRQ